jgi:molecular chaperone GrpE
MSQTTDRSTAESQDVAEVTESDVVTGSAQGEIEALRAEKQALFEKLARVQADFANSRRRLESDFDQRLAYANQSLISQLLPVIDNFERTASQDPSKVDSAAILRGVELVLGQVAEVLAKFEVVPIAPQAGDDFDPNLHQAIMQQAGSFPEGKITMTLQKGYRMKDRVVRTAQVAVSSGASA